MAVVRSRPNSTFALACTLGPRLFGLDRTTAILIGAGSSICGAAAVMATAPVVRGRPEQVAVAVATVVGFGSVAMFLYPALFQLLDAIHPISTTSYGLWAGSTIHEVAQVVAAGHAVNEAAADTAVIAKMVRVMMLAPFLVALSAWFARSGARDATRARPPVTIPWFALGFVALAGVRSLAAAAIPPCSVAGPVTRSGTDIGLDVTVTFQSACSGRNNISLTMKWQDGHPLSVQEVMLQFSQPALNIEPFDVYLNGSGGTFSATNYALPLAGDWLIETRIVVDEYSLRRVVLHVPLAPS